jgi:hypothetical protein
VYGDPLEHPQTEEYWGNVNPIGELPLVMKLLDKTVKCAAEWLSLELELDQIPPMHWNLIVGVSTLGTGVRSCYDEGKRVAETLMFDYHRQHGIGNTSCWVWFVWFFVVAQSIFSSDPIFVGNMRHWRLRLANSHSLIYKSFTRGNKSSVTTFCWEGCSKRRGQSLSWFATGFVTSSSCKPKGMFS